MKERGRERERERKRDYVYLIQGETEVVLTKTHVHVHLVAEILDIKLIICIIIVSQIVKLIVWEDDP